MFAAQQPVHECAIILVGPAGKIGQIRRQRWQPGEIQKDTTHESGGIGLGRWLELLLRQSLLDEVVNAASRARFRRLKRPVALILGTLLDPDLQNLPLPRGERRFVRLRRWHDLVFVRADDALPRVGLGQITRDDAACTIAVLSRSIEGVQPQVALAMLGVKAVTGVAVLRQNRPHIAIELDLAKARRLRGLEGR